MDIYRIRKEMAMKPIFQIKMRVTFYARVSSEKDAQLNSLDNQVSYYTDFIKNNENWEYVEGYIDEGISGISTLKRENFNRMIDDAKDGKFDLVITKEISRFARNTLDSIQYTRELLNAGVGVFFQSDNINTLDQDAELRLTIMASLAQDELRKLSSRIKFGHKQAIQNGVVLGNSRIFGYTKNDGKLVIDEEEAKMIRELFELYASDNYSMKQLETLFWEKGYRNNNGKKIGHSTMSNLISNPKYKGYYVGGKVEIIDMFTKKQHFIPPEEWVLFKDETGETVPAIVSEELWNKANEVLSRRSMDVKHRQGICNHENLMTGKLFCAHCGKAYYRKDSRDRKGNKNSKWVCSGKINNGADTCPSFGIYEEELKEILFEVFKETSVEAQKYVDEYIEMFRQLESGGLAAEIKKTKDEIDLLNKQQSKLLLLSSKDAIDDASFVRMSDEIKTNLDKANRELFEMEQKYTERSELNEHLNKVKTVLENASKEVSAKQVIDRAFVNMYIDKIICQPTENGEMRLEIKIFTGKTTEKYLESLKIRTGQMSKKMIKAYEDGMK